MKYIFTCGGTGGHVYPAIAIANELAALNKDAKILFAGNADGMESGIVRNAGYEFADVNARPLVRRAILANIKNALLNVKAFFKALKTVNDFKPDYVLGTGGFVSFPVAIAAALTGRRVIVHEPNVFPGLANIWLAPFVKTVTLGFEETQKFFPAGKCVVTGNPVRRSIAKPDIKAGKKAFGIKSGSTLLVMPGSRAAKSINAAVLAALPYMKAVKNLIWMCGSSEFEEISKKIKAVKSPKIVLKKFIDRSDLAYAASDAALLRAGASTLTEITAGAVPSVLVPYPHATGNHQEKNAESFARRGAAIVVKDRELTAQVLSGAVKKILDKKTADKIRKELKASYKGNGAETIAKLILK